MPRAASIPRVGLASHPTATPRKPALPHAQPQRPARLYTLRSYTPMRFVSRVRFRMLGCEFTEVCEITGGGC